MPCYQPSAEDMMRSEINEPNEKVTQISRRLNELEGALCAVLNELESDGILNDIIHRAAKNGKYLGISEFWSKHKAKDVNRLQKDLDQYSEHELELIKNILKIK